MAKNKFEIVYLPVAQRDIKDIVSYIKRDSPNAAMKMIKTFDERIKILADFPESGKVPKDVRLKYSGYRIVVVGNYLVFYVIKNNTVEIRRILHGKRDYGFLL